METLERIFAARLPGTLELLRRMVEINSYTTNPTGVNRLGRLTAQAFAELGFESEFVPSVNPSYGDHLVCTRRGNGPRAIALITHLDTVFSPEEEERNQFFWRPEGDRIYGPGTMDIKGGTAMIYLVLTGLREAMPEVFNAVTWQVLANSSEEVLSHDFGALCLARFPLNTLAALVFECEGRVDRTVALVTQRKGRASFRIVVQGRGAHAGGRHFHGANAITQLARTIDRIHQFTDYERELTFNVGIAKGGTVTNRVPHQAEAELEMRAFDPEVYQAGKAAVAALAGEGSVRAVDDGYPCQVQVSLLHESPPWPRNAGSDRLFQIWQETGKRLGQSILPQARGGLSDGNLICHAVPTLDGLGPWGENDHCSERTPDLSKDQEYVDVTTFVPKATLNAWSVLRLLGVRADL